MIDDNDRKLFRNSAGSVKPLNYDGLLPDHITRLLTPQQEGFDPKQVFPKKVIPRNSKIVFARNTNKPTNALYPNEAAHPFTLDRDYIERIDADEYLLYQRGGLPHRRLKQLKADN